MSWPTIHWAAVPTVSSAELRAADAHALERYGIQPLQLMEIAGWQVGRFVDAYTGGIAGKRVVVVAGSGNNGCDALCAGRFLLQRGARVTASVVPPKDPNSLAARHAATLAQLGVSIRAAPEGIEPPVDVIIDGLLGTGVHQPLREPAPTIIATVNRSGATVVAVDVPSGMDADDGTGADRAIQAVATVTLAAPKAGLRRTPRSGRIFVADIGMTPHLFPRAGEGLKRIYRLGDLVELVEYTLS